MDLTYTPEQGAFRAEARAWLEDNVGRDPLPSFDTREGFEAHRAWERDLHAAGYAVVSWPVTYGGRGLDLHTWLIFEEEYWAAGAPLRVGQNGLFLLAPTLMEVGTPEQKERFLPRMANADDIWCQGWSEPNVGSDLASVSARAERRGDTWILNGQKTWCTRGAYADWMFGLFRSDPTSERHHGLTFVLVPMNAPGVTVRPIRQIDGGTGFAEVFLDDVEVPVAENTLGAIGEGWKVAMYPLDGHAIAGRRAHRPGIEPQQDLLVRDGPDAARDRASPPRRARRAEWDRRDRRGALARRVPVRASRADLCRNE
jgi:alkylation response protein AidB-like acyl-CoA dehydrogenase